MSIPGSSIGSNVVTSSHEGSQAFPDIEDFISLSDLIEDNNFMLPDLTELLENFGEENNKEGLACSGEDEMDFGLADLDLLRELSESSVNQTNIEGLTSLNGDGMDYSLGTVDYNQTTNYNGIPLVAGDGAFLELNDLNDPLPDWPLLVLEWYDGLGDHFDMSQVNNDVAEVIDLEHPASSCGDNFTPWEQLEEGN